MGLAIFYGALAIYLLFSYTYVGLIFWVDRQMLLDINQEHPMWIRIMTMVICFVLAPVLLIDIFLTRVAALTDLKETTGKQ
jgi:hypothetical protein